MMHVKSFQKFSLYGFLVSGIFFSVNVPSFAAISAGTTVPSGVPTTTIPSVSPAATPPAVTPTTAAPATASAPNTKTATDTTGTTIGQVIWVKGIVKAMQGETTRTLERRSPVYLHDVVTTDPSSSGEVSFTDSSIVTLSSGTELKMDEYDFSKNKTSGAGKEVMSLVKGGFRTITGAIPKDNPDGYQVNTPVATIGVRGTDYSLNYSESQGLVAKVDAGSITLRNDQGMIELSKELSKLYALVRLHEKPVILSKQPAVFGAQPPITPVSPSNSKGMPGGHGMPGDHGGSGPSKTVSSFCVGLLKGFYKTITDFFT